MENAPIIDLLVKLDEELQATEKQILREQLAVYINDLLLHNFNYLVYLLYRIDVPETKLKKLLQDSPQTDAALIISDLIIQRQDEKRKSKATHRKSTEQDDEERW